MKKPYTLECCVDSVESAVNAQEGGATRLELCAGLVIGGLSPSVALYRQVRRKCDLPVHVLLRPRFGDFLCTEDEFAVLLDEVELFRREGAQGVVIGCLTPDGALDLPRMEALMAAAGTLRVTLHRAFDMCRDPFRTYDLAARLGVASILTSGQKNTCAEGKALLCQLARRAAAGGPEILAGGGVSAGVVAEFLRDTPIRAFHLSGKRALDSGMRYRNPNVSMGAASLDEYAVWRTDPALVRAAAQVLEDELCAD